MEGSLVEEGLVEEGLEEDGLEEDDQVVGAWEEKVVVVEM